MRFIAAVFLLALIPLTLQGHYSRPHFRRRYRHFDDYLQSLNIREQELIDRLQNGFEIEGSGDVLDTWMEISPRYSIYAPYFRKKKDIACCALGVMAGDKGYHCYVDFYKARIISRNKNRAHNRKMISGTVDIEKSKEKTMKKFVQCVSVNHKVFHKCCHLASLKTRHYDRFDTRQKMEYRKKQYSNYRF